MLALLEDAVRVLQRAAGRETEDSRDVLDWVNAATEWSGYPFTFESVCLVLGIDPAHLRAGLNRFHAGGVRWSIGHRAIPLVRLGRARHLATARRASAG
jgi:hypothetical protein